MLSLCPRIQHRGAALPNFRAVISDTDDNNYKTIIYIYIIIIYLVRCRSIAAGFSCNKRKKRMSLGKDDEQRATAIYKDLPVAGVKSFVSPPSVQVVQALRIIFVFSSISSHRDTPKRLFPVSSHCRRDKRTTLHYSIIINDSTSATS